MFEAMLKGELNNHLGYANNSKERKKQLTEETVQLQRN
jgi:hypothetical protein